MLSRATRSTSSTRCFRWLPDAPAADEALKELRASFSYPQQKVLGLRVLDEFGKVITIGARLWLGEGCGTGIDPIEQFVDVSHEDVSRDDDWSGGDPGHCGVYVARASGRQAC
jgi:hypothetical protein